MKYQVVHYPKKLGGFSAIWDKDTKAPMLFSSDRFLALEAARILNKDLEQKQK